MKNKKTVKTISIIGVVLLLFYFSFIRGFYAFSDKWVDTYSGEITKSIRYFMNHDVWALATNKYKEPIFIYEKEAFMLAKSKFSNIFDYIYNTYKQEYKLTKINKHNLDTYRQLIEKLPVNTQEELQNKNYCLDFIDIYMNDLKRYIFVPGKGIIRTYPD